MQKPETIRWWEILFWISVILAVINLLVFSPSVSDLMQMVPAEEAATGPADTGTADRGTAAPAAPTPEELAMADKVVGTGEIIGAVVYVLVAALFWYFIARRGNNVFKWIWVVLAVLAVLSMLANLGMTFAFSVIGGIIGLIVLLLYIAEIVLLFLPASRPWFDGAARAGTLR